MIRFVLICLATALLAPAEVTYKVHLTASEGNRLVDLTAEKYVAAVLAGESSVFRSPEALKAMAVAVRTYAARLKGRHAAEGFDFCSTTHCQRLILSAVTAQLTAAASATAGELLWFEGKPAYSVYSRDCGGRAEAVSAVWPDIQAPYLKVHDDPYCTRRGSARWTWTERPERIVQALRKQSLQAPGHLENIAIVERTASHRARTLNLLGEPQSAHISATSFRFAVGRELGWSTLRSERYEIENRDGRIVFDGTGQGHGVGLCQSGADEMGLEALSYREILAFYYPGTTVARTGAGIDWIRSGGEGIAVLSTQPDRDREVLSISERARKNLEVRLKTDMQGKIEIRAYPDVDTFRNATGEPGWVAARTSGRRIDLQPVSVLKSRGVLAQTIQHEIAHVLLGSIAGPVLPVWFREGLVDYLSAPAHSLRADADVPNDDAIRQRQNAARARAAYTEARRRVANLVSRYGEATVLGWVVRGLPPEVTNARVSSPATNSK